MILEKKRPEMIPYHSITGDTYSRPVEVVIESVSLLGLLSVYI